MTDTLKTAIEAINKWLYYGWNYETLFHKWKAGDNDEEGEYLPEFIVNVKWTCNIHHMRDKWRKATESRNPDAYLTRFYAELDNDNRILLLEWLMQHYNGERHISFKNND